MTAQERPVRADVVVAGGGPAGATVAALLARAGASVLMVERAARPPWKVGESLPPSAAPFLLHLGVADDLERDGHLPCHGNVSLWGGEQPQNYDFLRSPYGSGWHLNRARFDERLVGAARAAGAHVWPGRHIIHAEWQPAAEDRGFWRLTLDGHEAEIVTPFVVDATGRASAFARCHAGARRVGDDRLVALVARLRASEDGDERQTVVEARREGWWYLAPLPGGGRVVAFHTDADLAGAPDKPARWRALLADTTEIRARLERSGASPEKASTPLRRFSAASAHLEPCAGAGWLAVGDAALAFDPLSSQGICSALWTGILAAEAITAHQCDADAGALPGYAAALRAHYADYRAQWSAYYARERRWPDAPFWQRRHVSPPGEPG